MRHERDPELRSQRGQLLLDLGRVTMARNPVCVHVLVRGHEVGLLGRGAAGAGYAGLCIDHDIGDQFGARERSEREQRRRRIAAWIGHQVCPREHVPVELGQPVDGIVEQLRREVLAVPLAVDRGIAQAEVRAQVDDPHLPLEQRRDHRRRRAVRVRDHRRVDVRMPVEVQLLEHERHAVTRVKIVEPAPDVRARGDRNQLEARMRMEQSRRQRPAKSGRAEHRDPKRHGCSPPAQLRATA